MSGHPTVPPPRDDDHEDVAWALRAASAQWRREDVADAISWVRRAAETADEVGDGDRASELLSLAIQLAGGGGAVSPGPSPAANLAVAPPARSAAIAPPPPIAPVFEDDIVDVDVDVEMVDDEVEFVDADDDEEEIIIEDEIEDLGPSSTFPSSTFPSSTFPSSTFPSSTFPSSTFPSSSAPPRGGRDAQSNYPSSLPAHGAPSSAPPPPPPPSAAPPSHSSVPPGALPPPTSMSPQVTSSLPSGPATGASMLAGPPSAARAHEGTRSLEPTFPTNRAPAPELFVEEVDDDDDVYVLDEEADFGEINFDSEAPTQNVSLAPISAPVPVLEVGSAPSHLPIDESTASEYAQSVEARRGPQETYEDIEQELGVDLSLDQAPVVGRASVRPSAPPGAIERSSSGRQPYPLAPSAEAPRVAPVDRPAIEPPSRPSQAPPSLSMLEPDRHDSSFPHIDGEPIVPGSSSDIPSGALAPARLPSEIPDIEDLAHEGGARGHRPSDIPVATEVRKAGTPSVAPGPLATSGEEDDEDLFSALDHLETPEPFEAPVVAPEPPRAGSEPPGALSVAAEVPEVEEPEASPTVVDGIDLMDLPGLQDLPEEAQAQLVSGAQLVSLDPGEEVSAFGVALVTAGSVHLMPTVADATCAIAKKGEVLFTQGTLPSAVQLRVVGAEPGSRVVIFSDEALKKATSDCPWVADELAEVGDRYNAFGGAVLGPLGDSLDDMFRGMVFEKCSVKNKPEGTIVAHAGKPMDGMYILGVGSLEIVGADGNVLEELGPGDFVFPETVLSSAPASSDVRVGAGGALMLYADRMGAHELLATCPPFIMILAG